MGHDQLTGTPRRAWTYAYQIVPPQPEHRLRAIKDLLHGEHTHARLEARTWEGRLVSEEQVTHIMVVSDTPDQALDINRRVETELRNLEAGFALTVPMAVEDEATPLPDGDA
jgi:hypothetical protein